MRRATIRALKETFLSLATLAAAVGVCLLLSRLNDDNNPFAASVFILAVAVVARFTTGYLYGVLAAGVGVLCVNFFFTRPFFQFNWSYTGYPLTFAVMLVVSVIISALTTRTKRQEQLRFEIETEKLRSDLLRSVSHDLRTPLSSILGASSVLLEHQQLPPKDRRELLEEIQKEARWLIRITENILSITRFTGNGVALKTEDEVLEEILSSAIVKFRRSHPEIAVFVDRPDSILLVRMDATLIEQVLLNLFENAAFHGKTTASIRVKVETLTGKAIVTVRDDGAGIDPEKLPSLFDGKPSSTDSHRHMGIGLNVCRAVIRAHGGEISAANAPEGGAEIRFWLPWEEEEHGE